MLNYTCMEKRIYFPQEHIHTYLQAYLQAGSQADSYLNVPIFFRSFQWFLFASDLFYQSQLSQLNSKFLIFL